MEAISTATSALGLTTVEIEHGTSGNYLSGFLGLHGLYYNHTHEDNVAAGHIHVGIGLPVDDATTLIETTLETLIATHPAASLDCP